MSWHLARRRIDECAVESFDEGGILCQCCPPFQEVRRGGRYVKITEETVKLLLLTRCCNTHKDREFKFLLKFSNIAPHIGKAMLYWETIGEYVVQPNTIDKFGEINVTNLLPRLGLGLLFFAFVTEADVYKKWPPINECDFTTTYSITRIVCENVRQQENDQQ